MSDIAASALGIADAQPRHTVANTYGNPQSLARSFRLRRFERIKPLIDRIVARKGSCRIADIGGTEYYWNIFGSYVADTPVEIDLINLTAEPVSQPKFRGLAGDATDLSAIPDRSYDLVHSNSVIEHVGTWTAMSRMATNVRRLAPVYYVQTPNFWFPYEPHFRVPFFHWLPEQVRARLCMQMNLGFGGQQTTLDAAMRRVQSACVIDRGQLAELFPDAVIKRERVLGLTKSIMAIREPA